MAEPVNPLGNRIQSLAESMPIANNQIASGLQQARQTQLQRAFGQSTRAGQPITSPAQIQQMAGQQAKQAGQIQLGITQQAQVQARQMAGMQLSEEQRKNKLQIADQARTLQKQRRNIEAQLFSMGREYKERLLDDQMQFERDQAGRTLFNERQLADFAVLNAKNDEDFAAYELQVSQASQKRLKMLEVSLQKVKQALEQGFSEREQKLDFETRKQLAIAKQELEKKINREKAKQANRAAIWSSVGMIAGAAIGGSATFGAGSATGAMAGAAIGQGVGNIVSGTTGV